MDLEKEINILKNKVKELEKIITKKNEYKNEKEKSLIKKRDKTKYLFKNKIYPKNRLVLNVIKSYVEEFKPTFSELQNIFDKSLQGSLNVIDGIDEVKKISDYKKRYFCDDKIILKDKIIVVCNQWGSFNINKFIKIAVNLGYNINILD